MQPCIHQNNISRGGEPRYIALKQLLTAMTIKLPQRNARIEEALATIGWFGEFVLYACKLVLLFCRRLISTSLQTCTRFLNPLRYSETL